MSHNFTKNKKIIEKLFKKRINFSFRIMREECNCLSSINT